MSPIEPPRQPTAAAAGGSNARHDGPHEGPNAARRYWRTNLTYLAVLLSVWFIVSFGCGILFVDFLNQYRIGHAKLGFWFAQQGSIYVFVVIIAVYVILMNRLDRRFGYREA